MFLKFFIVKFIIDFECMYLLLNVYIMLYFGLKSVVKEGKVFYFVLFK